MDETRKAEDPEAHDVLAAEEFAMPGADPTIRHGPVLLPDDPTGILEPHDILAAEEFAMPAIRKQPAAIQRRGAPIPPVWVLLIAGALLLLRRRRRRRRRPQEL